MATLTWTAADGTSTVLDGTAKVTALLELAGSDVAPRELSTARRLSADGSAKIGSRWGERTVFMPILVNDTVNLGETIASLAYDLVGPGTLSYDDGNRVRELRSVEYRGGLDGQRGPELGGFGPWMKYTVELVALDPWWYEDGSTASLTLTGATAFDAVLAFDDASTLFDGSAASPVSVSGHAGAYPIATVTGPFDTLQVGLAGGQTWELTAALAAGSVITVDTRPGNRGPRLNGGAVDWSLLTEASRLFELPVGPSTLVAQSTGSTGASSVEVAWDERYLTP